MTATPKAAKPSPIPQGAVEVTILKDRPVTPESRAQLIRVIEQIGASARAREAAHAAD